jgi:hypothetical protein
MSKHAFSKNVFADAVLNNVIFQWLPRAGSAASKAHAASG